VGLNFSGEGGGSKNRERAYPEERKSEGVFTLVHLTSLWKDKKGEIYNCLWQDAGRSKGKKRV